MKRKKTRCWKGYKPVKGKRPYSKGSCRKVVRRMKIPLRTARAMVRAGLPLSRSELLGNQSRFQRGLNKSIRPVMKEKVSYYSLAKIVEAIKNLKKRNYNDEMIESVVVKERPGHPRDFIIIVKHRYFVNGARVYSAGLKTEETIEKFVRVIGTKTKRIGNSDYVFNVYGVRFPEAIQTRAGKLFGNNSMSERYKERSKRYLVTKKFTSGYMKGMTIVDESPVPLYVGFKPSKPYFGSPYIVTKTQVNFTGKRNLLPNPKSFYTEKTWPKYQRH